MSSSLVSVLHHEERAIVAELRASKPFQRLEAIRRLLALYDVQPSVAAGLDVPVAADAERNSGEVIHFAAAPPPAPAPAPMMTAAPAAPAAPSMSAAVQAAVQAAVAPAPAAPVAPPIMATAPKAAIAMPAPAAPVPAPEPVAKVAALAEAAVADAARSPMPAMSAEPVSQSVQESASVVSSVRAALLGIGKH